MKTKILLLLAALALLMTYFINKDRVVFNRLLPADTTLPDNSKYYGELKAGVFEGEGELVWADGDRYLGHFKQGLMHGSGELWEVNGDYYSGSFKNGMMHGLGQLTFYDGSVYQGEFKRNHMTGAATLREADGTVFVGNFKQGVLVEGSYTDADNNRYEGTFENWLLAGFGSYTSADGDVYKGEFKQGVLHGQGQIQLSNGALYVGEVADWMYEGKGKLIDEEGNQYQGEFEFNEFHGEGTMVLAKPIDGITEISGQWQYGFHEDDPKFKMLFGQQVATVDELLYSQNSLLSESMSQVSKSDKDFIDLYFLGMAAHDQDVFYQEIEYIENYFNDQFETKHKSITLVNSPIKSSKLPLVTNHAIQYVLDQLAEVMDVNQDVLFLYLTSHGTKEQISVSYAGLELAQIDAKQFGAVLKNSPIKWKVIMISACYSGSFIPYLKDDHHLVMTAAREDRVSFGCGEGSDMTYFAKAMFKEALPQHDSFIAAFTAAEQVIEQWENEDFPDSQHSKPQIYIGSKIATQLQQWRQQMLSQKQQQIN